MKNNYFFIIFFFFFGCSSNLDVKIDIEELKKQGITIHEAEQEDIKLETEVLKINNVSLTIDPFEVYQWHYPNYNSSNLLPNVKLKISYQFLKSNSFFKKISDKPSRVNILYTENKLFYVDDFSNVIILNDNLKLIKKIRLYQIVEKNFPMKFNLAIDKNILYISDNLGSIFAIDINNYNIIWKNNLGVPFISNLVIYQKSVFVLNANGKLYSFNNKSGLQNWSFETGSELILSSDSFRIALSKNKIFFSNNLGDIYCIDLNKNVIAWTFKVPLNKKSNNFNLFKFSNLVIDKENLYFSTSFGDFFNLDINTGKILWKNRSFAPRSLVVNKNHIFFIDDKGFLNIYKKNSGEIVLKKNLLNSLKEKKLPTKNIFFTNLFIASDEIFVTSSNGFFFIINSNNINSFTYKKISKMIDSNLIILDNKIIFLGENSYIYKVI